MQTSDGRQLLVAAVGFGLVGLGFSTGWLAQARFMETPVSVVCEPPATPPPPTTCLPPRAVATVPEAPLSAAVLGLGGLSVHEADDTESARELLDSRRTISDALGPPPEDAAPPAWDGPFLGDEALELTVGQTHEVHVHGRVVDVLADPPLLTWSYTPDGLRLFATAEGVGSLSVETADTRVTVAVTVAPQAGAPEEEDEDDSVALNVVTLPTVGTRSRR